LDKREPQVSPGGRKVLFLVEKGLGVINGAIFILLSGGF